MNRVPAPGVVRGVSAISLTESAAGAAICSEEEKSVVVDVVDLSCALKAFRKYVLSALLLIVSRSVLCTRLPTLCQVKKHDIPSKA